MKRNLILVVLLAMIPACDMTGDRPSVVNHSFAKPDQVAVEHMALDLDIDFDAEQIRGRVTLRIANKTGADKLYLDTRGLVIHDVTLGVSGNPTEYTLGKTVEGIGQALIIDIMPGTKSVTVFYETTEGATALDWLSPEQTAGGKMPFLYTQGQSILNRTWIPCQDSPEVRITYDARIQVPAGMLVVMSASNSTIRSDDGVYEFSMPQPIPTYLIALAAGDLEFRAISDRCGVYAEPYIVDRAAWEFADTESMIQTAEALYGPYRWDRYDVIVLPPSFPYGGMENPRLSFVTPVLVAGDRSLVSTIAHELAHSWSGNLVTNATWDDFWLNEGFTVYFERRIMEAVYGRDDAELDAVLGVNELKEKIESFGENHPDTRLALDVSDRNDPDEGLSTVAYNKGYLFLRLVEESVGRERMDAFLNKYFDTFAFQSMTSERFVEYLRAELIRGDEALEAKIGIDEWVYGTGLPANAPEIRSIKIEDVEVAITSFEMGTPPAQLETDDWSAQEWKLFLQGLPEAMTLAQMKSLDDAFGLTDASNGELQQVWFLHAIESGYEPAYPNIEAYLVEIGRIWLIARVYRKLAETPEGLQMAQEIYAKAKPGYHPLTVQVIDGILDKE